MTEGAQVDLDLLEAALGGLGSGSWAMVDDELVEVSSGAVLGSLGVAEGRFVVAAHALVPGLVKELREARRVMASSRGVDRAAVLDEEYRYLLKRHWGDGERVLTFCMLNPSVADGLNDDPTVRRCVGFARGLGYDGLQVVNLYALRATDPRELRRHAAPIGPENDAHLAAVVGGTVVAAWGSHAFARERSREVYEMFAAAGTRVLCLGVTRDGYPRHPLFLPADSKLSAWAPR